MSRVYSGTVVWQKDPKTVKVQLISHQLHPKYHKVIKTKKNVQVHNEKFSLKPGEKVKIKSCRPYSKTKRFLIIEVVGK